jgi:glutamate-5-semialdehyde dehydrogenase
VPNAAVQLVATRDAVDALLELSEYIDLVIPRGSNDLVRHCQRKAHMPVLGHADGLCSIYIHSDADAQMAAAVVVDSKTDYPAACNAVETLLVHESVLHTVLPAVATALFAKGVTLKCDAPAKAALTATLPGSAHLLLQDSVESDYDTEFLDIVLAVRTVPSSPATPPDQTSPSTSLSFAIAHINTHGSHHTECILTASKAVSEEFFAGVDAACKFWNCSTRFCDGMRFGFGTEVGISTNKVHARGPVGLEGLTIHEYRLSGQGQVAASYSGAGARAYTHRKLDL